MIRSRRGAVVLAAPLLLLACSEGDGRRSGGVTADEASELNEAAGTLDAGGTRPGTTADNSQDLP